MKSTLTLTLAVAAVALLTACIPSVNPFYTASDLVQDNRLLGDWEETPGHGDSWSFKHGDDKGYKATLTDKEGKRAEFLAHLFRLKQELFLDITPSDCRFDPDQADLAGYAVFPGHLLMRVTQLEPELKVAYCDYDWLSKYLEKHPTALAHHLEEKRIVLTAGTRELQKFVLRHIAKDELFKAPTAFAHPD